MVRKTFDLDRNILFHIFYDEKNRLGLQIGGDGKMDFLIVCTFVDFTSYTLLCYSSYCCKLFDSFITLFFQHYASCKFMTSNWYVLLRNVVLVENSKCKIFITTNVHCNAIIQVFEKNLLCPISDDLVQKIN